MNGPSDDTLRNLAGMLPSAAKGFAEGKIRGKGVKSTPPRPRKLCKVCAKLFDYVVPQNGEETAIIGAFCDDCAKLKAEGWMPLVSGDRYAWVKSDRLKDIQEDVIQISDGVMDKVAETFVVDVKLKELSDKTKTDAAGEV